jgi:hypothetical protein
MRSRSRPPLEVKEIEPETVSAEIVAEPAVTEAPPVSAREAIVRDGMDEPAPEPRLPAPVPTASDPVGGAKAAYPLAIMAALLWIGGVASYVAYQVGGGQLELDPSNIALLSLIALAPAGLFLVIAHMMRQASALAVEARRARTMADSLGLPTGIAVQESGQVLLGLRSDIELSAQAAENARNELAALRAAMEEETRRLNEAADLAQRTARRLSEQLSKERLQLTELGGKLETQTQDVIETVERQARMVADASDLAQTQLREAEATLAARTADMASAAGEAQDAARVAADDLARQTMRLETAGSGVADQIRSVEEGLSEQRAALVQAAFGLRRDQEDFAAQVETQRAQLSEALALARVAGSEMSENSAVGAQALQELLEAAADQVKALSDMSQTEARAFDARTREALDRFEDLTAQARESAVQESERTLADLQGALERSRGASDEAVAQARQRIDRLGELAFEAGRTADQAAETRLEAARRVVEETAAMGEEAAQRIAERLETNLMEARAALAHVEDSLGRIDERAARLPDEAKARIDEIARAVEASLETLTEASRRAAAETEAVDNAFQDRVKRNYDMLTEAVRLMGVVSGEGPASASRRSPPQAESAETLGLRGRLRLAPTDRDEVVRRTFEPEAPAAPPPEAMSWKELLAGAGDPDLDTDEREPQGPAVDAASLMADVSGVIRDMGIDPAALLPRARVEEASQALSDGDASRARDIVRRVAPAAVRRISRRVLTDRPLRADVDRIVRHYARTLAESARSGDPGGVSALLASDSGRAFLLLDAAVGDLS